MTASTSCCTTWRRCRWRDRELFDSVNVVGTANVLVAARDARVAKVVHTSSSAVFGVPESNPVAEDAPCRPLEAYGRAKLRAEQLCHEAAAGAGLDVTIVRPRTILGHGRLGIFAVLFDFVAEGAPVYVLGSGDNRYQLVHADDLADACLRAGDRKGPTTYNVGAVEFGTMRATIQALVDHAGTGSTVRSLPTAPAQLAMRSLGDRRARAVRAVPLVDVRRVVVLRRHRRRAPSSAGSPATPTPRCSSSRTTGTSRTATVISRRRIPPSVAGAPRSPEGAAPAAVRSSACVLACR